MDLEWRHWPCQNCHRPEREPRLDDSFPAKHQPAAVDVHWRLGSPGSGHDLHYACGDGCRRRQFPSPRSDGLCYEWNAQSALRWADLQNGHQGAAACAHGEHAEHFCTVRRDIRGNGDSVDKLHRPEHRPELRLRLRRSKRGARPHAGRDRAIHRRLQGCLNHHHHRAFKIGDGKRRNSWADRQQLRVGCSRQSRLPRPVHSGCRNRNDSGNRERGHRRFHRWRGECYPGWRCAPVCALCSGRRSGVCRFLDHSGAERRTSLPDRH